MGIKNFTTGSSPALRHSIEAEMQALSPIIFDHVYLPDMGPQQVSFMNIVPKDLLLFR